jgi:hypothetical protein
MPFYNVYYVMEVEAEDEEEAERIADGEITFVSPLRFDRVEEERP